MPPTFYGNLAARNETLQGFVTGFSQSTERFKAKIVAPVRVVPSIAGNFPTMTIANELRIPNTHWDGYAPANFGALAYSNTDYVLALDRFDVPRSAVQQPSIPPEDVPEASTRLAAQTLYKRLELKALTSLQALASYLTTHRDTISAAGDKWTAATSNPLSYAQTAKAAITMVSDSPTQMCAPIAVWQALARHPMLQEMTKYTDGSQLDKMQVDVIAKALDFGRGVNLDASYDSSNPGGTSTPARMWGNHVIFNTYDDSDKVPTDGHCRLLSMDNDLVVADSYVSQDGITTTYWGWMSSLILYTNQYAGYLLRTVI